jgi:hypothetical protein
MRDYLKMSKKLSTKIIIYDICALKFILLNTTKSSTVIQSHKILLESSTSYYMLQILLCMS